MDGTAATMGGGVLHARRSPVTAAGSRLAGLHTRSGGCCRGWPPAAASDKVGLFIVHAAVQDHCQTGNAGERPSSTLSPPRGPSSRLRGRPCRRALPSRARSLCTPPLHHRSRSGFRRRTGKVQSCRDVDGHDLPTRAWSRTERYFCLPHACTASSSVFIQGKQGQPIHQSVWVEIASPVTAHRATGVNTDTARSTQHARQFAGASPSQRLGASVSRPQSPRSRACRRQRSLRQLSR